MGPSKKNFHINVENVFFSQKTLNFHENRSENCKQYLKFQNRNRIDVAKVSDLKNNLE